MSDKMPMVAAETGTYLTSAPSPHVNLSGTAVNLGTIMPSRTFTQAAADASLDFDSGDTCQVMVVNQADNSVFAVYENTTWTAGSPDMLDFSGASLVSSEGTLTNSDAVNCWAQVPYDRVMPDAEGVSQGRPPQADGSGDWTV